MGTKGRSWKWSDESRAKQSEAAKQRSPSDEMRRRATTHGLSRTLSYNSWRKMMQRCYQENNPDYYLYGGRGIFVIQRWHNVVNFVEDMGEREKGMSLERVNVNGHYCPENCIWIPHRWQGKNRRPWQHTPEGLDAIRAARSRNG